jgi:eukaryotic-like serine/threonine-protein kinase
MLRDGGLLPVEQVLDITIQVTQGLAYAHEHGIVHRDVKPSNIMMLDDGHVKITDFGIARMASSAVRTQTGMVLGSPKYMSPEQVLGKTLDQRSDIFSLGVMLYELLTGRTPFMGEDVNAIMYQTLNTIPPPPSSINPAVPDMLNFIVAKALAKAVDDRYQDAREFAGDLRACRDMLLRSGAPVETTLPPSAAAPLVRAKGGAEEFTPAPTMGLSTAFDSTTATMRLAELTSEPEEVEEFSRTLKLEQSGTAAQVKAASPATVLRKEKVVAAGNSGNLLLFGIIVLVLLGLAAILFS